MLLIYVHNSFTLDLVILLVYCSSISYGIIDIMIHIIHDIYYMAKYNST